MPHRAIGLPYDTGGREEGSFGAAVAWPCQRLRSAGSEHRANRGPFPKTGASYRADGVCPSGQSSRASWPRTSSSLSAARATGAPRVPL